jgi:hypothetical protein
MQVLSWDHKLSDQEMHGVTLGTEPPIIVPYGWCHYPPANPPMNYDAFILSTSLLAGQCYTPEPHHRADNVLRLRGNRSARI